MDRIAELVNGAWMKKYFRPVIIMAIFGIAFLVVGGVLMGLRSMSAQAAPLKVGLITQPGPLDDMSWNWDSYQGLLRAQKPS